MRSRFLIALTLFAPWALAGCEDGPNQTYSPPPNGAANNWNNSNTPGATDKSKQGYTSSESTGKNKVELCTGPEKQVRWKAMVQEPIVPPHGGGGIDMAGKDCQMGASTSCSWAGITIEEAEKINCQSEEAGDPFGDGTPVNYWGDNAEVWFCYSAQTRLGEWMDFWPGYQGPAGHGAVESFYDRKDGSPPDTFNVNINAAITKNGIPYPIDWFGPSFASQVNELGRTWLQTFAPFLSEETISSCYGGLCITGSFGNVAYIYIPVIGLGVWTPNSAATGSQNIIDRVDLYLNKVLPFSMAYPYLKLDAEGPLAIPIGGTLGVRTDPCVLKFGMNYADFLQNCVRVTGEDAKDDIEQNKLFGSFAHGREQYEFGISGVDVDFGSEALPADKILGDPVKEADGRLCVLGNTDPNCPKAEDLVKEWAVPQGIMGRIRNDRLHNVDVGPRDNHGMGLVWMEYARIVQAEMNKWLTAHGEPTHELGDPACLVDNPPNGCTGMEGFVTCAPFTDGVDPAELKKLAQGYDPALNTPGTCVTTGCQPGFANCDGDANTPTPGTYEATTKGAGCERAVGYPKCGFINTDMQPGMTPGHPPSTFCVDPVDDPMIDPALNVPTNGFTKCTGGDLWQTSFDQVLKVFGHGDLEQMPYEVRDTRFFFHATMEALVKYLIAEAAHPGVATITDVHNAEYNYDDLHFDSAGAGQWETAAYIDRRFVGAVGDSTLVPVEFTITADIKNGIFNDYSYVRQLYRGEKLVYTAVQEDKTKGLGAGSTAQITNVMGSPVLENGWVTTAYRDAFLCATMDPDDYPDDAVWASEIKKCDGQHPPMIRNPQSNRDIERDEDGKPILTHYKGAFAGYGTALKLMRNSPLKVDSIQWQIMSADFTIPVYKDPYSSKNVTGDLKMMVPFEPKQPGLGFNVPINGQLDKFISTYHSDLSGRTISMHLAWDWTIDPLTMQPKGDGSIDVLGFHADDFLGDVFLCQDAATKDLMRARMYTTTDYLLDWLIEHPAAADDCEIIIRYSPFGNYPDYISSLTNGVMVGVNQGGGKGRIIDAQMWIPGL